ncbi:MAG TPA: thermonuclease family protein [Solirubrobacterales bacterium]|nr:thermonuclease family protein [Solirubrobacterales bacterium]
MRARSRSSLGSAALIALILGAIAYSALPDSAATGPVSEASGMAPVVRVVDGDTVILAGLGSSRIVGVDTPETVKPDTPVQCFGPRASAFSKHVLGAAGRVRYRVALEPVDAYGRSLVYLWLPDGRFFNAMLVRRGLARPLPFPPNTRYAPLFARLALSAARRGRGLWGRC